MHGKVRHFDEKDQLIYVGVYQNGLPHGPFWFYSPFHQEFAHVYFQHGHIAHQNVVLINRDSDAINIGKLDADHETFQDVSETKIEATGDLHCIKVVKVKSGGGTHRTTKSLQWPLKIKVDGYRISGTCPMSNLHLCALKKMDNCLFTFFEEMTCFVHIFLKKKS